jgi:large subunit ribosomal protein L3
MTTWLTTSGEAIPCTVVAIEHGNIVTQMKSVGKDGYSSLQIGYKLAKEKTMTKPELGHLKRVEAPALRHLVEFAIDNLPDVKLGDNIKLFDEFNEGDLVDVMGKSIGKGFQGGVKRWNMHRGLMTHGSNSHRAPGSIGMRYSGDGGRVIPGLKMPGHMGNNRVTVRKLKILKIDKELNAMVIMGSLPGKQGSILKITPAKIVGKNYK